MMRKLINGCVLLCYLSFFVSAQQDSEHEKYLMENLEELFIIKEIEVKNDIKPFGYRILSNLIEDDKIKDSSAVMSISMYSMTDKSNKYAGVGFEIWYFDTNDNAKSYFDILKSLVHSDVSYEKPPNRFFINSNKLYYFFTDASKRNRYMVKAEEKLIECCFSKNELQFSHDGDRK